MTDVEQAFQLVVDFLRRKGFVPEATTLENQSAKVKQLSNAPTRLEALLLKGLVYEQGDSLLPNTGDTSPLVSQKKALNWKTDQQCLSKSVNTVPKESLPSRSDPPTLSFLARMNHSNQISLPSRSTYRHSREPHTPLREIPGKRATSVFVTRLADPPIPVITLPPVTSVEGSTRAPSLPVPNDPESVKGNNVDEYEDDEDVGFTTGTKTLALIQENDLRISTRGEGMIEIYPKFNDENGTDIGDLYSKKNEIIETENELKPIEKTKKRVFAISGGKTKINNTKVSNKTRHKESTENDFSDFNIVSNPGDPQLEYFNLKIIYRKFHTGFEESRDFPITIHDIVAGRYEITAYIGSAAFSRAVQCIDHKTGQKACMKIIKNNKDFFDQCLDELKLLKFINLSGDSEKYHVLKMFDYFYFKEHLFIVCELLMDNLYEFYKKNMTNPDEPHYFTLPRIQKVAKQCLVAIEFIHSLNLIHCDLKPENILMKNVENCEIKVIDFGSSCYTTDVLSTYVQSRSYRAPEVILGLHYGKKIDMWSLGCILAELLTGRVIFQNYSVVTLLSRIIGIIGPIPEDMLAQGNFVGKYFTVEGDLYENTELITPKKTTLRRRVKTEDILFLDFLRKLLTIDPQQRPTATEALQHPWLKKVYTDENAM